jgi:hypothetical protein
MATYRFRITFEDYDDVSRDIEIRSTQTFDDLHYAIHNAIGFDASKEASFFMSDDNWKKGKEITTRDIPDNQAGVITPMRNTRLCDFIADPHQKIYYSFDPGSHWTFHIELIKISRDEENGASYPRCIKSAGEAPKQYQTTTIGSLPVPEDFDLLAEEDELEDESDIETAVDEVDDLSIAESDLPIEREKIPFVSTDDVTSDDDFETADEDSMDDDGADDKDDF